MRRRAASVLALLLPLACAGLPRGEAVSVSDGRYVMGTVLQITLVAPDAARGRAALEEAFALARRLEALTTSFEPESELSRLNRAAGGGPRRVEGELSALVARSLELGRLTGGAFDVTVGPLVALWREAAARGELPAPALLARARARVGPSVLRVLPDGRVDLRRAGAAVDLGGIAKGYALDRLRQRLARRGIERALLDFGRSSVWALGRAPDAGSWRLLARGPDEEPLGVLELRDRSLSVSGSLGQWVEIGGRRYGHVLDPRSGRPLRRRRQALVLARDATLAEALSKALLVLGEGEGIALLESQPGCEALLVDAAGGAWRTSGWDAATRFRPLPRAASASQGPRGRIRSGEGEGAHLPHL